MKISGIIEALENAQLEYGDKECRFHIETADYETITIYPASDYSINTYPCNIKRGFAEEIEICIAESENL